MLKVSCSDNSKAVMLRPLSAIAVFRTLVEFYQKTFSEHCSFCSEIFYIQLKSAFLYLLVAILVDIDAEEVKYRSQHPIIIFRKKTASSNI